MEMHSWTVAAAVLAGLALLTGCNGELTPQARQLLLSGYDAYEAGNDADVVRRMDEFLAAYDECRRVDEALYLRGMARYRLKNLPDAKSDLSEAVARTEQDELRAKALAALGDLAYESGDMTSAENSYRQATEFVKDGEKPSGHVRYRLGCVLQRRGRWYDADLEFNKVFRHCDGMPLGDAAARRTHCTVWTVQMGAFANKRLGEAQARRLRETGASSSVRAVSKGNRLLFLVQTGRYSTYRQAVAALPTVAGDVRDAFVTVTR